MPASKKAASAGPTEPAETKRKPAKNGPAKHQPAKRAANEPAAAASAKKAAPGTSKAAAPRRRKRSLERVVFFGTPEFAVPTLDALAGAGLTPQLIVSQPARPAGRGQQEQSPAVAEWAAAHGVELAQPESVKDPALAAKLRALAPDVAVVVAFGQIFPKSLLDLPRHGCVNLHASLLPKYRGASPIQAALIAGEKKTGVTVMRMEEGLDSGPILLQEETKVRSWESAGELSERLAKLGGEAVVEALALLVAGKLKERKQREESATYAGRIDKDDGRVNWALESEEIYNRLRAYTPWPGVVTHFHGRPLKIVWGVPMTWESAPIGVTGTYLGLRQGRIAILCGNNTIFGIEELQRPGKKRIRASDFVNGERLRVGDAFA